jgi:hypothetical protein
LGKVAVSYRHFVSTGRYIAVPVDKLAISPDLKAAVDWRRPVDRVPGCYRGFVAVVIDLVGGEHVAF